MQPSINSLFLFHDIFPMARVQAQELSYGSSTMLPHVLPHVLPHALPHALPSAGSEFITLLQLSSFCKWDIAGRSFSPLPFPPCSVQVLSAAGPGQTARFHPKWFASGKGIFVAGQSSKPHLCFSVCLHSPSFPLHKVAALLCVDLANL